MRRIFNPTRPHKLLVLFRQQVIHPIPTHKRRSPQRHIHLLSTPIIIPQRLASPLRHRHSQKRRHLWRVEIIERSINMPAIEAGEVQIIFL